MDHLKCPSCNREINYIFLCYKGKTYCRFNCNECKNIQIVDTGSSIFTNIKEAANRISLFIEGPRKKFPPSVRKYLKENGNKKIIRMSVYRAPISETIQKILNIVSFGNWNKVKNKLNYDDIFHLGLKFELIDKTGIIEKNHVIQINKFRNEKNSETMSVDISGKEFNLNILLLNTKKAYSSEKEFFDYNAVTNNCQRFIYSILKENNLLTNELKKFILQDAKEIIKFYPGIEKVINAVTGLATRGDILIYGGILCKIIK